MFVLKLIKFCSEAKIKSNGIPCFPLTRNRFQRSPKTNLLEAKKRFKFLANSVFSYVCDVSSLDLSAGSVYPLGG